MNRVRVGVGLSLPCPEAALQLQGAAARVGDGDHLAAAAPPADDSDPGARHPNAGAVTAAAALHAAAVG